LKLIKAGETHTEIESVGAQEKIEDYVFTEEFVMAPKNSPPRHFGNQICLQRLAETECKQRNPSQDSTVLHLFLHQRGEAERIRAYDVCTTSLFT
jgi:hypothetical protein